MTALCFVAAVAALAWVLHRRSSECPICGGRAWMCLGCSARAIRRLMADNAPRPGEWTDEDEAGSTAYLYEGRSGE